MWRLVEFLLEGFVFLLIGQQLPTVVRGLKDYPAHVVVAAALVTVGLTLLLRPLWLLLTVARCRTGCAIGRRRPAGNPLTGRGPDRAELGRAREA